MPERVLITGAAGELGGVLARRLAGRYELRLTDRHPPEEQYGAPFVAADISDLDAMLAVCDGIDSV
ncbi:MAG TPA: NAD-dependent epimerase/dehydratase family protein, partial [Herpetosiphonaceae bacterium]|nr:NAD-dependent epimerase/dehydratase family protein [Herpetosiphonaceae bacterium]